MRMQKYVGDDYREVLSKVRAEMGPDAIILSTRHFRTGFMKYFGFGKKQVEVVVALDNDGTRDNEQKINEREPRDISSLKDAVERAISANENLGKGKKHEGNGWESASKEDISPEHIPIARPIEFAEGRCCRVLAFIGPTGVGKTTTIAKLAARFSLDQNKKVALLTLDTYRVAAVDQLRAYADMLNVPLMICNDNVQVKEALAKFQDRDIVLIDTAGRSQNDIVQLNQLKELLQSVSNIGSYLVLSATTKEKDLFDIVQKYSFTKVQKLIITKLDETSSYQEVLKLSMKTGIPLAYFTMGQNVPDDIEEVTFKCVVDIIEKEKGS